VKIHKLKTIVIILGMLFSLGWKWGSNYNEGRIPAHDVRLNVDNFDTNLSSSDTDVQAAMDTLDDLIAGASSPLTTKGDLYGFSTVDARIPVGANGQLLQADSTQALGVKWSTIAGAGDVTAAAALGDNLLIRGDGAGKGVQNSGISIDDSDNITGINDSSIKRTINTPIDSQSITAASDTITSTNTINNISSDADYLMTATPTISAGSDGQWLVLRNTGNFVITLQDNGILGGSDVFHGGSNGTINPDDLATLLYTAENGGGWEIQSHPNTQVSSNASSITVRASEALGSALLPVYISGYNVGLSLMTVGIADQDDPAKMPSIGITISAISNNATGQIVTSGVIENVNTSAFSLNDALYVSDSGTLTNTKPTLDDIQAVARVSRSNASTGSVMVVGAGRSNDVPRSMSATSLLLSGLTASELLGTDASKNLVSLAVATYPSLAEFAWLKGMTSKVIDDDQIDTFAELDAVVADKALVNKADGAVWSGVHNFGGATTLEIPQDKTTAVEGQITVDGTSGQFRYHGNSAQRVLSYLYPDSKTVENIAAADDAVPFGSKTYARVITKVGCRCIGTCTTAAEFSFSDSAANAFTLAATPTCATTGAITYQNVNSGGALIAGEGMLFNVTNAVSPETDWYEITWEETITAD